MSTIAPATQSVAITLTDLRKDFGETAAVDGVSLEVPAGSFLVLLGPSGCGKTTTLRMLAGLENPTGGEIRFGERVIARGDGTVLVPPAQREAGLVFQSYALWPHKTVRQNIEWPLAVAKWDSAKRTRRTTEVLEMLGIDELAERYPGEISGGQQQRVAIARMIAPKPSVLLFDEPLSNLDAKLRVDTRGELMRVHRATGATSVYVTHDQVEAMTMATHVALMKDGRVEQFGTPRELLASPRSAFTATFIGTPPANILPAYVRAKRLTYGGVDCGRAPVGMGDGRVQLMYRAGSLALAPAGVAGAAGAGAGGAAGAGGRGSVIPGRFADQVPMAESWVMGIDLEDGTRLTVTESAPTDLQVGDAVAVRLPDAPDAIFGEDGQLVDEVIR